MSKPLPKPFDDDFDIWSLNTPELHARGRHSPTQQRRFEFGDYDSGFDFDQSTSLRSRPTSEKVAAAKEATIRRVDEEDPSNAKIFSFVSGQLNVLCGHVLVHPFVALRRQCQVGF